MTSRMTTRIPALTALAAFIAASSGCEPPIENLAELCSWSTYTVTDPHAVGPGGDKFCDWTTGECEDLRSALNTANVCWDYGPKTVELPPGGHYQIADVNVPPAYRRTPSERHLLRIGNQVGLPHVYSETVVQGRGSTIEVLDDVVGVRHFHVETIGELTLVDLTLMGARGPRKGGSIYNEGILDLVGVTFDSNEASREGGALYNAGGARATAVDSVFQNLQAGGGAAIFDAGGVPDAAGTCPPLTGNSLVVEGARIVANFAGVGRGTIVHVETCARARITETTFDANTGLVTPLFDGTPLWSSGELLVEESTFSNNAAIESGGLWVFGGSTTVESSTFSRNTGRSTSAIRCGARPGTTLDLVDVTVSDNTTELPHGFAVTASRECRMMAASNTIVGENSHGDCDTIHPVVESGVNASSDGTCFSTIVPAPLGLGSLAANGGSTETMLPSATSPLVGAAGSTCLALDQRGKGRPVGGACELGAVERQPDDP